MSSRRRETATKKFVQIGTKLFACDEIHVEVVGENKPPHGDEDTIAFERKNVDRHPEVPHYQGNDSKSVEENVDERRGDKHDGRHGRGGLMMWLNSEISGCVDGGSTNVDRDHHVDEENSYGRYQLDYNNSD